MLSNNPGLTALAVVFITGVLLFALGTFIVRRERQEQTPNVIPSDPAIILTPLEDRIDQIERLALVGQPWCIEQLERDFLTDTDADVRNAAEDALVVIRARGAA